MIQRQSLEAVFATERPVLVALAYRMVGSFADAEDIVQDAFVRARAAAPDELESPGGYLRTTTTRTAIDFLRSARVRRESYIGPWLPEPVAVDPAPDVSEAAELADSLSMALLVVLETLPAAERAVLLLHDVFGASHTETAETVGVTVANSRQILRRARQHVAQRRPRRCADPGQHRAVVEQFAAACMGGDFDAFLELLSTDAVYVADGGASTKAARHPLSGPRLRRFLSYIYGRPVAERSVAILDLNGAPALAIRDGGVLTSVMFIDLDPEGRPAQFYVIRNPEKLARVGAESPAA